MIRHVRLLVLDVWSAHGLTHELELGVFRGALDGTVEVVEGYSIGVGDEQLVFQLILKGLRKALILLLLTCLARLVLICKLDLLFGS